MIPPPLLFRPPYLTFMRLIKSSIRARPFKVLSRSYPKPVRIPL